MSLNSPNMEESAVAYVKTRRAGRSLIVTLPREVAELLRLRESEVVRITVERPNRDHFGADRKVAGFKLTERADPRD